mgnify:CR=1 FL=1
MIPIKVLVPSGVLGLGFDLEALNNGVKNNPDIISIDGGSTDSGPFSLGSGTSKYSRAAIKAEWKSLMIAREKAKVPLVIGSCGTCGTNGMVDWMENITIGLAEELNQHFKIAKLVVTGKNLILQFKKPINEKNYTDETRVGSEAAKVAHAREWRAR